jgi:cell division septation protein DedD
MKSQFYHTPSAGFVSGKVIVITFVVFSSALSFLLGYFVGKNQGTGETIPVTVTGFHDTAEIGQGLQDERGRTETAGEFMPGSETADESRVSGSIGSEQVQRDRSERETSSLTSAKGDSSVAKGEGPGTSSVPKRSGAREKSSSDREKAAALKGKKSLYFAIQVGAFVNLNEAKKLKKSLSNKGYTVTIDASGRKKRIYRVRVGSFSSRKSAETQAIKIARNEGLKTLIVNREN